MMGQLLADLYYPIAVIGLVSLLAIIALGLNIQWSLAGIFNPGLYAFVAIGLYCTQITVAGYTPPLLLSVPFAVAISALLGYLVSKICIKLPVDYLPIAVFGLAEALHPVFAGNSLFVIGVQTGEAIAGGESLATQMSLLVGSLACMVAVILLVRRALLPPLLRVMAALRENPEAAKAVGKNIEFLRRQNFVLGAAIMGLGGAMMAPYLELFAGDISDPRLVTLIIWSIVIFGGSYGNRGIVIASLVLSPFWVNAAIVDEYKNISMMAFGFLLLLFVRRYRFAWLPGWGNRHNGSNSIG